MPNIEIGKNISENDTLWRYMSLDKLIHLVDTQTLYFTPLSSYDNSDPFEGYPPKIILTALSDVMGKPRQDLEVAYQKLVAFAKENDPLAQNTMGQEKLRQLRTGIDSIEKKLQDDFKKIAKGSTVNCWHKNLHESEAMWKLYSESGKGIAVKTTVGSLLRAINSSSQNLKIKIGAVKYINFDDPNLQIKDCVSDGVLNPLLKRSSFSHENEVRLYTIADITPQTIDSFQPKPSIVNINIEDLIEEIFISPFASEPFISSSEAICKKYGINHHKVKRSTLLKGHHELLAALTTST